MSATQATVTNTQVAVKYWQNVSSLSIDMLADNRTTTLSRHINQHNYVGRHIDRCLTDISADMSTDTSRLTYQWTLYPYVGWYVNRYIGRVSVHMTTDTSVEGCTKYTIQIYLDNQLEYPKSLTLLFDWCLVNKTVQPFSHFTPY